MRNPLLFLLLFPLLLSPILAQTSPANPKIIWATCTKVSDGDTYKATVQSKKGVYYITVRCDGIDAPERGQKYSKESKAYLEQLILNKDVMIWDRGRDRYNRVLGQTIILSENDYIPLELTMLRTGMAWHFKKYNSEPALSNAEKEARRNRVGLWQDPSPTAPWNYRKKKTKSSTK